MKSQKTNKRGGTLALLSRLVGYMFKYYKIQLIVVILCITLNSVAAISSSIFIERIVDDIITPGVANGWDTVKDKLFTIIGIMSGIYVAGLIASFVYNRIMAHVTQGFLYHIRNDMFKKMQSLPIKYFDTNTHGDIMSIYTNDTDAIRQLISQSIPQAYASFVAILTLLVAMLVSSIWLTLVVLAGVAVMVVTIRLIGGKSAKYFMRQQIALGRTEGFIEEMMQGQKVVKVFCHEQQSKEDFDNINDALFKDSEKANKYANILMPTLGNIGHVLYVVVAIVGGAQSHADGTRRRRYRNGRNRRIFEYEQAVYFQYIASIYAAQLRCYGYCGRGQDFPLARSRVGD